MSKVTTVNGTPTAYATPIGPFLPVEEILRREQEARQEAGDESTAKWREARNAFGGLKAAQVDTLGAHAVAPGKKPSGAVVKAALAAATAAIPMHKIAAFGQAARQAANAVLAENAG